MRTLLGLLLVLSLAGCGRSSSPDDDGNPTPTPTPLEGDELIFAAMLAGEMSAADGIAAVDASGGWPIDTPTGFVFVRLDGAGAPWSLAGDHNGWTPAPMEAADGFWWARVVIAQPVGSIYKFVDGGSAYHADPFARRYGWDEFGEFSLVDETAAHRERFSNVTDGTVASRTVRMWVPAGAVTRHLYVHDGQNLFDPTAPFGGWKLDETLGAGTLAIGIDNTPARMDEYTHVPDDLGSGPIGGDGDDYADFVNETVRPLIEARYGVPSTRGTMGSSLGGLIAFHLALRFDGEYDFAASLSGTMGWGSLGAGVTNETMIEREIAAGHRSTILYLDSGGSEGSGCVDSDADGVNDDGDDSDNYCTNRQLADALDAIGYTFDTDLHHWHEAGAAHDEAAWAARVFRPITLFEAL